MSLSIVGYISSASALVLMLVTMSSCYDDGPYKDLLAYQEGLASSTGETEGMGEPQPGSSVSTSLTGTAGGDSSSGGGGALDLGDELEPQAVHPEIFEFTATPGQVNAAGPLLLDLKVSDDVQEIELIRADKGGGTLAKLPPEELPFHHAIVSAADNGSHRYRAIARNDQGEEARAELEVTVALPATGQEVWSWESDHPGSEALAILPLDGGAVVVGYIVKDEEPRPVVSRISNTGKLLWEVLPNDERGYACALTLRPQGDLIVIGNTYEDDITFEQSMWTRQLSLDGEVSPTWGDDGVTGERAWAVATDEFGQLVVAGDFQSSDMKPDNDFALRVWFYDSDGASRWTSTWTRPGELLAPDEQAHAALFLPSGDILVAGHTSRYLAMPTREQALILKLDQGGNFDDAWIDDNSEHFTSKVDSLVRNDKGDLFVSGQAVDAATKTRRAMVWRVDEDLKTQLWSRAVGQGDDAFAKSVRLTANNDVIVGSTMDARFQVSIAKPAGNSPWIWQEKLELAGGPDLLLDLTLDPYDYIYVSGQAMIGANHRAYARRLSP